jgi:hypothetical protein
MKLTWIKNKIAQEKPSFITAFVAIPVKNSIKPITELNSAKIGGLGLKFSREGGYI